MTPRRVVVVVAAVAFGSAAATAPAATSGARAAGTAELVKTIHRIESKPRYRQSDWGYQVVDQRTGKVLAGQNTRKMFDPGSTMKLYSVSAALAAYGPDYRFRTPVYRQGPVAGGALGGNLVLVASGDLSLGLREQPNGTLYYESLPAANQSYADQLPGAVEPPGNPLAGLDELAQSVRASGITQVNGDVIVDDRLFEVYDGFPDGLMSAIWVNENLIDLLVTPGTVGGPASIAPRPITGTYVVDNKVTTVAKGRPTDLTVSEPTKGTIEVRGTIAAGSPSTLKIWEVADPAAFARTAFIEALGRAGVTVTAATTGPNPAALLPAKDSYSASDMVGEHVSAQLSQFAKLILKVSWNRGADVMACLVAVRLGSTDCADGMRGEVRHAVSLGVPRNGVVPQDGAGSDDQGRTTPAAMVTLLRRVATTSYGNTLVDALPILGRDGTLANVLPRSPAAGHAQIKTGNRVVSNSAGQIIVLGNSLAGYVQTRSGRHVVVMIAVGNVPIRTALAFLNVVNDQALMLEAIYKDL
jgi:D-alanyl-D-alanine carboxypeptidase/D-alanyl-D-alanine-endopeptidase (penicillin-binding protein 4)